MSQVEVQRNLFRARAFVASFLMTAMSWGCWAQTLAPMRPPAVPLIAHDPYFSVWSTADHLADNTTQHWTGKPNTLNAMVRIDGRTYRVMGRSPIPRGRQGLPALDQKSVQVLPTRTLYTFSGSGINLGLTFFTPALPDDLDVLSRPLTYIEWKASSSDGRSHEVSMARWKWPRYRQAARISGAQRGRRAVCENASGPRGLAEILSARW